jgi:hypothetical protein
VPQVADVLKKVAEQATFAVNHRADGRPAGR